MGVGDAFNFQLIFMSGVKYSILFRISMYMTGAVQDAKNSKLDIYPAYFADNNYQRERYFIIASIGCAIQLVMIDKIFFSYYLVSKYPGVLFPL